LSNQQPKRIRGRKLQRIRRDAFKRQPLCVECLKRGRVMPAEELDHMIPLCKGGSDTAENRQALCVACHATKTRKDLGQRPKYRVNLQGYRVDDAGNEVW
jgi:5-methylcytosine-specific restriction enzyme A